MQAQQVRNIIEQAANAWMRLDPDAFASLFTPDGEIVGLNSHMVGQAAIRQFVIDFSTIASDVSIKISQILIAHPSMDNSEVDRAVVEWHWESIEKSTGWQYLADDAIIINFRDGRISRWREYADSNISSRKKH
jgi:uncharacterized protein (TIGR02246 family)